MPTWFVAEKLAHTVNLDVMSGVLATLQNVATLYLRDPAGNNAEGLSARMEVLSCDAHKLKGSRETFLALFT
jgi:hypothetical protein